MITVIKQMMNAAISANIHHQLKSSLFFTNIQAKFASAKIQMAFPNNQIPIIAENITITKIKFFIIFI